MNDKEFKKKAFCTVANAFNILLFTNKSMQKLKGFRFHRSFETSSLGTSIERYQGSNRYQYR